jgi:hypothetical protein
MTAPSIAPPRSVAGVIVAIGLVITFVAVVFLAVGAIR